MNWWRIACFAVVGVAASRRFGYLDGVAIIAALDILAAQRTVLVQNRLYPDA